MLYIWTILTAALLLLAVWFRQRYRDLEAFERYQAELFDAVGNIVSDERTPSSISSFAYLMAKLSRSGRLPWQILYSLLQSERSGDEKNKCIAGPDKSSQSDIAQQISRDLEVLPEDLRHELFKAIAAFALGVSFRSSVAGFILRRLTLFRIRKRGEENGNSSYTGIEEAFDLTRIATFGRLA